MILLLMGVSGSGKTTIGQLLAERTGAIFADADDYHSAANKQKMAAGTPLNDMDRGPWLEALNELLRSWVAAGQNGVLACSALKGRYRDTLSAGLPPHELQFVFLEASKQTLEARLAQRHHEYMNPRLLESQLETLEVPIDAVRVLNDRTPELVAGEILAHVTSEPGPQTSFPGVEALQ